MRPVVVILRDLTKTDCRELARLLSRHPEYGIAQPSRVWLRRQEEKIDTLPKSLLSSKNMIQRIAVGLMSQYDKNHRDRDKILPPGAVLCHSHERLNPYLIRNIFLMLVYEVSGDYMGALRSVPAKTPAIAAFLRRINSLHALWVSRKAFDAIFGIAPCEHLYVQVQNNCEACILSAIGANESVLADLYGWLSVRRDDVKRFNEQHKARGGTRRRRPILLHRIVDAWIKHLKPEDIVEVRCRAEEITKELKDIWDLIAKIKSEIFHTSKKDKHHEVHLSKTGKHKMIEVRGRSHGFGIPLPRASLETAEQRDTVCIDPGLSAKSSHHADTIVDDVDNLSWEEVIGSYYLSGSHSQRSFGDESFQRQGNSPGINPSFEPSTRYFTTGEPLSRPSVDDDDELYENDKLCHQQYNEHDSVAEAQSVAQVQSWYQQQIMITKKTDFHKLDQRGIHPAFQRPMTSNSAVPPPLHPRLSDREQSSHPGHDEWSQRNREETNHDLNLGNADGKSVWTDASVYTTTDAFDRGGRGETSMNSHTSQVTQLPPYPYKHQSSRPHQTEADRRKYLFHDSGSDVASRLTQNNKKYLKQHSGEMREIPAKTNPFVRQGSTRKIDDIGRGARGRTRYEGYAAQNREVKERQYLDRKQQEHQTNPSFQNNPPTPRVAMQSTKPLFECKPNLDAEETQWQTTWEQEELTPMDSVSNLNWEE